MLPAPHLATSPPHNYTGEVGKRTEAYLYTRCICIDLRSRAAHLLLIDRARSEDRVREYKRLLKMLNLRRHLAGCKCKGFARPNSIHVFSLTSHSGNVREWMWIGWMSMGYSVCRWYGMYIQMLLNGTTYIRQTKPATQSDVLLLFLKV